MRQEIAILREGERIWIAEAPADTLPSFTAPVALIQGIYEQEPALARKIMRHRIYTTVAPSESVHGMVKVAAKRITYSETGLSPDKETASKIVRLTSESAPLPQAPDLGSFSGTETDQERMAYVFRLAEGIRREGALYACDRPVAAILVSKEGKLLGAALNTNARNRTRHAEMNLIQAYCKTSGRKLPEGSRIYVSLKPCKMCAGMIHDSAEKIETVRVFYGADDPGTNAKNTAFDRLNPANQVPLFIR